MKINCPTIPISWMVSLPWSILFAMGQAISLNSITPLEYAVWNWTFSCQNSLNGITSFESHLVERHHSLGVCSSHSVNQMVERHHSSGVCHSQSNRLRWNCVTP
jgi:hypothetical protein